MCGRPSKKTGESILNAPAFVKLFVRRKRIAVTTGATATPDPSFGAGQRLHFTPLLLQSAAQCGEKIAGEFVMRIDSERRLQLLLRFRIALQIRERAAPKIKHEGPVG